MTPLTARPSLHDQESTHSWVPVERECFTNLVTPAESTRSEARAILSRCIAPHHEPGTRTGLVVGYVQSGKTSSFTAVAALARDNGFQVVVVVSGSSTNLFEQNARRVSDSFRATDPAGWRSLKTSDLNKRTMLTEAQSLQASLKFWTIESAAKAHKKTIVVFAMKNEKHLSKLNELFDLAKIGWATALIIDDEADQASMNYSKTVGSESSIYRQLRVLRSYFARTSFLQYTATPQAPLLIRLDDCLSPEFCIVLSPGDSYCGAQRYFGSEQSSLISEIPASDVLLAQQSGTAPRSLETALAFYLLGVVQYLRSPDDLGTGNRTMMIHPDRLRDSHADYAQFVRGILRKWRVALQSSETDDDLLDMKEVFTSAIRILNIGLPNERLSDYWISLADALDVVSVEQINASDVGKKKINWESATFLILVGATLLDRGFTVEGLTVTYMPRPLANSANADNVQQRARWFGYKEKYLAYCQVWLESTTLRAFREILDHEEAMRKALQAVTGPLRDWRRGFFLDPSLSLTRSSVIRLKLLSGGTSRRSEWVSQSAPTSSSGLPRNSELVSRCFEDFAFVEWRGSESWTPTQKAVYCDSVPLARVLSFLQEFQIESGTDFTRFVGVGMQIARFLEKEPMATCAVVKMSSDGSEWIARRRDKTRRLHQGPDPRPGGKASPFPGDQDIRFDTLVTLQIFKIQVENPGIDTNAVAVWLPENVVKHHYVESR